jgi:transcription elongation factor Elf1
MKELKCPYCGHMMEAPEGCYEEDTTYEANCGACDKNFTFSIYISRTYSSEQAECLNDAEHKWEPVRGYPPEAVKNRFRCSVCDREEKRESIKESEAKHEVS